MDQTTSADAETLADLIGNDMTICGEAGLLELVTGMPIAEAQTFLAARGGLGALPKLALRDLMSGGQLDVAQALRLKAAIEIGRRLAACPVSTRTHVWCPSVVADMLIHEMSSLLFE